MSKFILCCIPEKSLLKGCRLLLYNLSISYNLTAITQAWNKVLSRHPQSTLIKWEFTPNLTIMLNVSIFKVKEGICKKYLFKLTGTKIKVSEHHTLVQRHCQLQPKCNEAVSQVLTCRVERVEVHRQPKKNYLQRTACNVPVPFLVW